jgi:dephospho-CoA kinase
MSASFGPGAEAESGARPSRPRRVRATGDRLYVVGVTGGVASGKSTLVAELRAASGAGSGSGSGSGSGAGAGAGPSVVVVDADRLGHAILARPAIARALAEAFGADILDPATGAVRRDVLGPRAFADDASLARLDAIVRPPLVDELDRILSAHVTQAGAPGSPARLVVLDAALLVEWDAGDRCDEVVAVIARPGTQVERLVRTRGKTEEEAKAIVARQLPAAARAAYADVVIENDSSLEEFRSEASRVAEGIRTRALAAVGGNGPDVAPV